MSPTNGAAVLCNDAALRGPDTGDGVWTAVGNPTEAALVAAGAKLDLDQAGLTGRLPRTADLAFDSVRNE